MSVSEILRHQDSAKVDEQVADVVVLTGGGEEYLQESKQMREHGCYHIRWRAGGGSSNSPMVHGGGISDWYPGSKVAWKMVMRYQTGILVA